MRAVVSIKHVYTEKGKNKQHYYCFIIIHSLLLDIREERGFNMNFIFSAF